MNGGGAFLAGAVVSKLTMDVSGWRSSVAEVKKDQADIQKQGGITASSIGTLGKVTAAAGAAIVGSFTAMALTTAKFGEEVLATSKKTGISVESLSAYKLVCDTSETSIDGLATGMKFLGKNMLETDDKTSKASVTFKALGVDVKDSHGNLRDMESVLLDVADKFKGMEDGPVKATLATELFGKAGRDLIPLLNQGSQAIREQKDQARELGIVMSQEDAEAADNFGDSITTLKIGLQGAAQQLGTAVIPMLTGFVTKVTDVVKKVTEWVQAHPGLTKAIAGVALGLGGLMTIVGPLLMILPKLAQGWNLVAGGIKGVTAAKVASVAAWTAVLALAMKYVVTLQEINDAEEYERKAGARLAEVQGNLSYKLAKAAVNAGLQYGEMAKLIDAHHGNVAALAMEIQHGEHGLELQKGLAAAGAEHNKVIEDQKNKTNALIPALAGAAKETKDWTDYLESKGILVAGKKAEKVAELDGVLKSLNQAYKDGKVTTDEYTKAVAALNTDMEPFGRYVTNGAVALNTATGKGRDFYNVMKLAPKQTESATYAIMSFDEQIDDMADKVGMSAETIRGMIWELKRMQLTALGIDLGPFPGWPKEEIKKQTIDPINEAFAGLYNDIAQGFGNTFQTFVKTWSVDKLLKLDIDFKAFFKDLWGNIKDSFFTMVGEIATKWVKGFLEDCLIKKTAEAAAATATSTASIGSTIGGLATSIASVIGALATAVGTAIVTIATSIATAIVALATGIATAATVLAAAAPALLVVGGIALAIFAGFKAIESLFGGGGGKSSDVTYWLKMMHADGKELHDWVINLPAAYFNAWHNFFFGTEWATRETVNCLMGQMGYLGSILDTLRSIDSQFSKLRGAAAGAVSTGTELLVVHGTPSIPEVTAPLPDIGKIAEIAGVGGRTVNVMFTAQFDIRALDGESIRDVVREKVGPELVEWVKSNLGKRELGTALGV